MAEQLIYALCCQPGSPRCAASQRKVTTKADTLPAPSTARGSPCRSRLMRSCAGKQEATLTLYVCSLLGSGEAGTASHAPYPAPLGRQCWQAELCFTGPLEPRALAPGLSRSGGPCQPHGPALQLPSCFPSAAWWVAAATHSLPASLGCCAILHAGLRQCKDSGGREGY